MANLISALDMHTPSQLGENGSKEYTWSNDIRERIVQLSFQITRVRDDETIKKLATQTQQILSGLSAQHRAGVLSKETFLGYMSIMYRMIGHTRDIIDGKGEYTLAYMLLTVWHRMYPRLAEFALKQFLVVPENKPDFHPYGCWKDIKYLYKYSNDCSLVTYGLELLIQQLRQDVANSATANTITLAAKWVPREKTQYGKLFTELAIMYFSEYLSTARNEEVKERAIRKAKTDFRKLISGLNKRLDTVQIKQCGGNWAEIEPTRQTSITLRGQKKAFLNVKKDGTQRSELEDRIICGDKFKEFAKKASTGEVTVKGKRVGLNDFTKDAVLLISECVKNETHFADSDEVRLLNAQWRDNATQTGKLGKMIAMVDVSGSMYGDPMYAAIALGIRIAQNSMLGKRVLTFSAQPEWCNLDGYDEFVDMVNVVRQANWGMNTNIYAGFKMILDAIILHNLKPEDVEDMILTILSDMQIDVADTSSKTDSLMDSIDKMYAEAGNKLWGKPFKAPHIVFWNLRSTSGFPTLSTKKNCSMVAGFSPAILNLFCEEGIDALQSCTPWSLLVKSLDNERYNVLDQYMREFL